jgi:hypothetical protein
MHEQINVPRKFHEELLLRFIYPSCIHGAGVREPWRQQSNQWCDSQFTFHPVCQLSKLLFSASKFDGVLDR